MINNAGNCPPLALAISIDVKRPFSSVYGTEERPEFVNKYWKAGLIPHCVIVLNGMRRIALGYYGGGVRVESCKYMEQKNYIYDHNT